VNKEFFYCIFFSLCWSIFVAAQTNQAVTYLSGGGRFGDKIVCYTTAKWISFKCNIPLLLKPFKYSSMLWLGREEKKYSKEIVEQFEGVIPIESDQDIIEYEKENVVFENSGMYFRIDGCPELEQTIEYMLRDQFFVAELKNMLQPVVSLPTIDLPRDKVTVAVHIRKGGGFDKPLSSIQYYRTSMISRKFCADVRLPFKFLPEQYYVNQKKRILKLFNDIPLFVYIKNMILRKFVHIKKMILRQFYFYADVRWPSKFPPEQYYVNQIKRISKLFNDVPLFVYIFTDDRSPSRLVDRIKKVVNKNNITFSCRNRGNAHVVEDFYNMARFDCLIRSGSNFGLAAQLLGNHKVVIYPKHWQWEGKKLVIDEVSIIDHRGS